MRSIGKWSRAWSAYVASRPSHTDAQRIAAEKYSVLFDVTDPDGYVVMFRPGVNQEESTVRVVGGWLSVLPHVQAWAGRVKEAVDAENLASGIERRTMDSAA